VVSKHLGFGLELENLNVVQSIDQSINQSIKICIFGRES